MHVEVDAKAAGALPLSRDDRGGKDGLQGVAAAASLASQWEALQDHAFWPTQTHACVMSLHRTLLAQSPTLLLRAGQNARVTGLLPLCRDKGYFSRWRIMGGDELFEPTDALYDGMASAQELAKAAARLPQPLHLDRISQGSLLIPALRSALRGRALLSVRPALSSPTIALDASWTEPETHFNSGRRSDFRRARRRADAQGEVSFETLSPTVEEFDALFDEAIAVEYHSWKREAGTALAVDRPQEKFFRDYFRDACARGTFRVSFMRIDGKAVAMQLAIQWSGRYWLFKIGHDDSYSKCSPGTLLMLYGLGRAAAEGLRSYEFLGVIEPWITQLWTQDQHDCVQVRTYPFNVRGALALFRDAAFWLRHRLRPKRQ